MQRSATKEEQASFLKANGGKLAAVVGLLLVAGAVAYYNSRSTGGLPDSLHLIDATTGKTFTMARNKVRQLPMINPETGTATLIPFTESGGKRVVSDRYRGTLREMKDANKFIDVNSLEVRAGS